MPARHLPTVMLCLAAVSAAAGEAPARPRLCPEDAPPGVRLPERPGCGGSAPLRSGTRPGFVDLGNGTQLRVSGRAAFEAGIRR
ncbi:hypothetical protein [Methylobacterium sp. JK268]